MEFIVREIVRFWLPNTRVLESEKRMNSSEMSPPRASLAAKSAAEFPLMPTWPGTQTETISFPSLVNFICSSKIFIRIGWSYLRLDIAWKRIRQYYKIFFLRMLAKIIARSSLVNIKLSSGSRQVYGLQIIYLMETAVAATLSPVFEPSVKKKNSYEG